MDLSWCIICDNRIEDDELSLDDEQNSLLYCSDECRLKDEQKQQPEPEVKITTSRTTPYFSLLPLLPETKIPQTSNTSNNKFNTKRLLAKHKSTTNNTSFYPWIPLYRKKHQINYLLNSAASSATSNKKCSSSSASQPTVAGSPMTANAFITPSSFLISTK